MCKIQISLWSFAPAPTRIEVWWASSGQRAAHPLVLEGTSLAPPWNRYCICSSSIANRQHKPWCKVQDGAGDVLLSQLEAAGHKKQGTIPACWWKMSWVATLPNSVLNLWCPSLPGDPCNADHNPPNACRHHLMTLLARLKDTAAIISVN